MNNKISSSLNPIRKNILIKLSNRFGMPLHIYRPEIIESNVRSFINVFNKYYQKGVVCYAAKAGAHKEILKIVRKTGAGADVASAFELRNALESGISSNKITLNGNCKENSLIEIAIANNILIAADNIKEIGVISGIAGRLEKKAKVILRLSGFDIVNATSSAIFTAGKWSKFGENLKNIPEFINHIPSLEYISFLGFHTHIGSQITEIEPYLLVLSKMIEFGKIMKEKELICNIINLGGGFPVSYVNKKEWDSLLINIKNGIKNPLNVFVWENGKAGYTSLEKNHTWLGEKFYSRYPKEKTLEEILKGKVSLNRKNISTVKALEMLGNPQLIIEPGRSIMEDAGITIVKVNNTRIVADYHNLTTVEMGITSHGLALLDIPVNKWELISPEEMKKPFYTFIAGNLCFSGDLISKYKIILENEPKRGDIIMIHHTGAYTSTFFAANPNSMPKPGRILLNNSGKITVMKSMDKFEEVMG